MRILIAFTLLLIVTKGLNAQSIGYSGMEKIGSSKYLVVMDTKNFQDGNRLAVVTIDEKKGTKVKTIKVKDWKHKLGRGNDLESVCAIPKTKNEYLLVESGYWEGEFGRIFHVKFKDDKCKVINVYKVPSISPGGKNNPTGDNFEAVICMKQGDDLYVILGERGGTTRFPNGLLRIGILKEGKKKIDWKTHADNTIEIKLPKAAKTSKMMRTVTDLYLNENAILFASAAVDDSDIGPFKSYVYEVGQLWFKNEKLQLKKTRKAKLFTVDGFKIEALAASPDFMENSELSFGTEDEAYPGQWRALYSGN